MASHTIVKSTRFGMFQMYLMYVIENGCKMIGKFDLKKSRNYNTVYGKMHITNETIKERIKNRDIVRLMAKGVIKISHVEIDREYMTYHYEPTTLFKGVFSSMKSIVNEMDE